MFKKYIQDAELPLIMRDHAINYKDELNSLLEKIYINKYIPYKSAFSLIVNNGILVEVVSN